ncbi:AAA family ATPase [Nocardioides bizhenqiangii]|uniref:AAA family ATPase n=1 Tax=Nocardioides bizhenqiangii TaxID=3095076 RepID=A0ABZ0ZSI3_9ACTN|nr:AAA family ATPase [Nocardioides sp. HM61]WQQ27283.1 AAA family ATPase [Nocardioides sp. HM61]
MIRRERPEAVPPSLKERREPALEQLRAYDARRTVMKSQRRWPIDPSVIEGKDVVAALRALFFDKCAYCESAVDRDDRVPSRHRPPEEAAQLDGTVSRDHYWWMAYDWENLYLVCPTCRSNKGRLFPTNSGRVRAENRAWVDLILEQALLIDPCFHDPTEDLGYRHDGTMQGLTPRGTTTIDVLGLNRPDLVEARAAAASEVWEAIDRLPVSKREGTLPAAVTKLVADRKPYLGIRRWALDNHDREGIRPEGAQANVQPVAPPSLSRARLRAVTITNFRAIRDTSVEFPEPRSEEEPWLLLLGENGVGKSTLLKAVALALVDDETRRRLVPDASTCVRRGARRGRVRLEFTDGSVVEMRFRQDSGEFEVEGTTPPLVVLGYGPTRLPPQANHVPPPFARVDVDNLFDPFSPLSDAEKWLADADAVPTRQFNLHATSLKALLPMTPEDRLSRRNGRLYATSHGTSAQLEEMSDGFRSVIAMAADITMQLSSAWESLSSAEGLLLLDEIEVHLHPQWRWSIVSMLRTVFPRLRVIATTHDPLCLQQTRSGEVMLLRRDPVEGVRALPLDVPPGLRADQLLTGDWFGLTTTTDRGTAGLLERHGRLLVQPQTSKVRAERADLEDTLRERVGSFAETSIERMAQEVAAEVAKEERVDIKQAGEQVRRRLADSVLEAVAEKRAASR